MFLETHGDPHSPTVVLVHGIPGSPAVWAQVVEDLARDRHVVVPHLLGFGESRRDGDLGAVAQATELALTLEDEGFDRGLFVGHDFGGPVCLSLYKERPESFSGLVLMSTNTFPDTPIPFPLNLVDLPLVGTGMARMLFSRPALGQMLRRYGGREMGDPRSVRRIFTAALQNIGELYAEYPQILRELRVPTMVLWGDGDPFFPVAQGERLVGLVPDGTLRVVVGGGHFLPERCPNDVVAAIRSVPVVSLPTPGPS